ncbi:sugar-binding domain protein [Actinomyces sp. Chiba101]|uniref:Transcriptional regulator, LacI family n=1 Tax=Actinomyces denticolens TaxID=52767 RepID=A0ABY1I9E4_9ACTO|nr:MULTISPECIES: LacI family DNA-binding transcriptional regulator [Actinomyces]BAW94075.1 sugar-binding domain protein [Actinomyces sp. Chiba101]GAV95366.1 sugar-binding domain protein [Actinomyces denticolens]SHI80572.1 transcriptional regulator, LacI family [Actinomyces denticolens]SUU14048.1 Cryptic asc operon repressor [Actinomyces denticolens]
MSRMERRATMADIAKVAGVSRTTVSFVLNNRPDSRIPETTRSRILQAARDLDYRPQGTASLAHPRSSSALGVVTDILTGPQASSIIRGMQDAALREGMPLLLIPTTGRAEDDRRAVASLLEHRVGAIIHARASCAQVAVPTDARDTPTILVNCQASASGHPCVRPDEEAIARLEAEALLTGEHRDIGVVEVSGTDVGAQPRRDGYRASFSRAGIDWDGVATAVGYGTIQGGYRAAGQLLDANPWMTALLCGNNRMAIGAYEAVRERGLRVRDDVAIIGIDDEDLGPGQARPGLTCVALPFEEMGRVGVERLAAMLRGERVPARTLLPGRLVRRASL